MNSYQEKCIIDGTEYKIASDPNDTMRYEFIWDSDNRNYGLVSKLATYLLKWEEQIH